MELYLNFHNHTILVSAKEEALIGKIRDEFHFFIQDHVTQVHTTLELIADKNPQLSSLVAVKILEQAIIYRAGSRQFIDYFDKAMTIWDHTEENVKIYSQDPDLLYELAFLAIHSLLGQQLEFRGFCRIHAVAVSLGNLNAVLMLPSKGGKSTMLTHLLKHPEVNIISDDMPLVDRLGNIHPFPSKMSLDQKPESGLLSELTWREFKRSRYPVKWTAGLSQMKDRIETQSMHHRTLLIAGFRISLGPSALVQVPKWRMIGPLIEHMIVGMGLPQIIEMFLRFKITDALKLVSHAMIRTFCAFQLIRKSRCYHFYMGPDRSGNARLVLDKLLERK